MPSFQTTSPHLLRKKPNTSGKDSGSATPQQEDQANAAEKCGARFGHGHEDNVIATGEGAHTGRGLVSDVTDLEELTAQRVGIAVD